jgi:hypothetical protein
MIFLDFDWNPFYFARILITSFALSRALMDKKLKYSPKAPNQLGFL